MLIEAFSRPVFTPTWFFAAISILVPCLARYLPTSPEGEFNRLSSGPRRNTTVAPEKFILTGDEITLPALPAPRTAPALPILRAKRCPRNINGLSLTIPNNGIMEPPSLTASR